jgi:hypothetical protein
MERMEQTMTLELDRKEMENLIKLVFLGNWMVNIHQGEELEAEEFEDYEEYDDVLQKILACAKDAGLVSGIEEDEDGDLMPSEELDEYLSSFIEEYNDHTFWGMLIERMTSRDIAEHHSEDEIKAMDEKASIALFEKFSEKYVTEFEKHGMRRLWIVEKPVNLKVL